MTRRFVRFGAAMPVACALVLALALLADAACSRTVAAQGTTGTHPLVGTWDLAQLERATSTQALSPVANPVGMLIQDAGGHVLEIVTTAGRPSSLNAAEQFVSYQAFWGTYTVDANASTATYRIDGDLDPGRMGTRVVRSFERKGTQLILTESVDARPVSRTTWDRIPELEALPDYQHDVIGFWQWTAAGLYTATGVNVRPAYRDASVIVYTPTGHMAVLYLPPPGRKPFAGSVPTVEEARAATQGSVSYFGTYIVQPKSRAVFHYQLGAANPAAVADRSCGISTSRAHR